MTKTIKVYTTDNCAYCVMVKRYLSIKGYDFEEINVENDPVKRKEAIDISGAMTVPIVVITDDEGHKNITVGYNIGRLSSALS